MITRFYKFPNTEEETDKSLTTLTWPLTKSLKDLAVQCRLPHGKIDWTLLHYEIGKVGIGKWGKNCAHHFKPIKNTRHYKKWVLERRAQAGGFRQYLCAKAIPLGPTETVTLKVPSPPKVTNSDLDTGIGDVSMEMLDSFFNDSKTEEELPKLEASPLKTQTDQKDSPIRCHYGDGDVMDSVTHPSHVTCDGPLSPRQMPLGASPSTDAESIQDIALADDESFGSDRELNVCETSEIESDVKTLLCELVEDACELHDQKILSNVVMTLVGDSSSQRFLYLPSNLDLDTRDLEEAMRKLTLEVSAPGVELPESEDELTESDSEVTNEVAQDHPSDPKLVFQAEFNISIDNVDNISTDNVGVMLAGCDDDDDGPCQERAPSRKVTVSIAKVLDELDQFALAEQFLRKPTIVSSTSHGSLPVMRNNDFIEDKLSEDGCMEDVKCLRVSLSSPCVLTSTRFRLARKGSCLLKDNNQENIGAEGPADGDEDPSVPGVSPTSSQLHYECTERCNNSMTVIAPFVVEDTVYRISPSSSISSLDFDINDVYDYNADTEDLNENVHISGKDSNQQSRANSKSSSCSDVLHHAHPGFLLEKSVNESDLGLEVIDLNEGQGEPHGDRETDPSRPITAGVEKDDQSEPTESRGQSSSSQESLPSTGGCHVS